ncbi:YwdI family protein [Bacillus rubiinfantis]|uniref:YwdI family protein n=1 Tax=Bacillus rubiinfantis TaxID=1499680 RepID=UPI0005A98641|nr:YwdI family protein [Bacillus rubiinfantis]
MNISLQTCLKKIEEELQQAKAMPKPDLLRERIYSIKILCELILDGQQAAQVGEESKISASALQPSVYKPPATSLQPQKLEVDDEANGDSLFDF